MKTIQSIKISNFQSHKNTTVNFVDGMNSIIGKSNAGKTAIIRAMVWVFFNKPSGDSFRSNWGGDTKVEIRLSDGTVIERIKGKSKNCYVINGKTYKAIRQSVPDEVKAIINVSDINVQHQLDAPFLLSESAGEVGRYLNRIINLDSIDRSQKSIASTIRSIKSDKNYVSNDIEEKTNELKKNYSWLDDAEAMINELSVLSSIIRRNSDDIRVLSDVINDIDEINDDLKSIRWVAKAEKDVDKLILMSEKIDNTASVIQLLSKFVNEIADIQSDISAIEKAVELEDKINELISLSNQNRVIIETISSAKRVIDDIEEIQDQLMSFSYLKIKEKKLGRLFKIHSETEKAESLVSQLNSIIRKIEKYDSKIVSIVNDSNKLQKQFDKLMPNVCPLCGK